MAFSMNLSVIILSMLNPSFSSPQITNSSSSPPTFSARLIHKSSPEYPFHNPNAPVEHVKSSFRKSLARSQLFGSILTNNLSMKPFAPYHLVKGDYVMRFQIGTPPVDTYAIADTGSDLIWLQCQPCIACFPQPVPIFDPSNSSSYHQVLRGSMECNHTVGESGSECEGTQQPCLCTYDISYKDEAYSHGDIARESFTLLDDSPTNVSVDMIFGCGHNNSDIQDGEAPGVAGLTNVSSSMLRQLGYFEFSYCFSTNTSSVHSKITFGGNPDVLEGCTTALAPLTPDGLYIFKNFDGIYVEGDKVDIPEWVFQYAEGGRGGLILDTGTIYTRLYSLALDALVASLRDHISFDPINDPDTFNDPWPLCFKSEDLDKILLPGIEFRFTDSNDQSLTFIDENIWIQSYEAKCLAFITTNDTSVLGIYQQRDMRFGFDLRRQLVSMIYTFC